MSNSSELQAIYERRFDAQMAYRDQVWKILIADYFFRFVPTQGSVLDLGCGYGEFINNVACRKKYAMDLNSNARLHLHTDVEFIEQDCSERWPLPDDSLDLVFTSNFFEHLPSKEALSKTLAEVRRCLKPEARLIAVGPNIKFLGGAYWDFWDHHVALSDASLAEVLQLRGFRVERMINRFLPYTMVNRRPAPASLISLYLKLPFVWPIFGKQFLAVAVKNTAARPHPTGL